MEMNGGSTASYLACTPCVPVFLLVFKGLEAKGRLDFQGQRGIIVVVRWNLRPVIFGVDFEGRMLKIKMFLIWGQRIRIKRCCHIHQCSCTH